MFQFPGFALKPLCIQGKSTWLTPLLSAPKCNNNRISGGFPHSDISGSKPIPGSPKLNAGYHVLHRLLLPRHPPNALFALDLIQKEQDHWFKSAHPFQDQKLRTSHRAAIVITTPVSVLDLETVSFLFSRTDASHTRAHQTIPMFFSIYDVNFVRHPCE